MLRGFLAAPLIIAMLSAPAAALPRFVTVELFRAKSNIDRVIVAGPARIMAPRLATSFQPPYAIRADGLDIVIEPVARSGQSNHMVRLRPFCRARSLTIASDGQPVFLSLGNAKRGYLGELTFRSDGHQQLIVRNKVATRNYVYSVVGSESNPDFRPEALKAQSVLTQTMLARYKESDIINDTTERQAYLGTDYARHSVSQAVDQTWSQILTHKQTPITVYFHATCAGGTSNGEQYFGLQKGNYPYLSGTECKHCLGSPFFKKKVAPIPKTILAKAFGTADPKVTARDKRDRPLTVQLGNRTLKGFTFWTELGTKLGWDKVPGTRYSVQPAASGGSTGTAMIAITSSGGGHGVGLCQWGANGLAKLGKSYKEILEFYFPGTQVLQTK